jgi:hypothetical protein
VKVIQLTTCNDKGHQLLEIPPTPPSLSLSSGPMAHIQNYVVIEQTENPKEGDIRNDPNYNKEV